MSELRGREMHEFFASDAWTRVRESIPPRVRPLALPVGVPNLVLFIVLAATRCDLPWAVVLLLWTNIALWAWMTPSSTPFFGGFLFAFAVLLLSRASLERVFGYHERGSGPAGEPKTVTILQIGLFVVSAVYILTKWFVTRVRRERALRVGRVAVTRVLSLQNCLGLSTEKLQERIRAGALVVMTILWPIAVVTMSWVLVKSGGITSYQQSYTSASIASPVSAPWRILSSYSVDGLMIAFYVFLASLPRMRDLRIPLIIATSVQALLLLGGARSDLTLFVLVMVCYAVLRNRLTPGEGWMTRKKVAAILGGGLALGIVFTLMERWRGVGRSHSLISFLYNQGVSIKVIDNVVKFGDELPRQHYWLEFAHSGILARIFGLPVLQGNSIERAMYGDSLGHALSLLVLGRTRYLSGIATGSSFLAEGFVEWGFFGVIVSSLVIGLMLAFIDSFSVTAPVMNAVRLTVAPAILWSPRGSTFSFITTLLAPATVVVVTAVLAWVLLRPKFNLDRFGPAFYGGRILPRPCRRRPGEVKSPE